MVKRRDKPRYRLDITPLIKAKLEEYAATGQSLTGALEDTLKRHTELLAKFARYGDIPGELFERLRARRKPYQSTASVLEELLAIAEKVEKMEIDFSKVTKQKQ